MGVFVGVAPVNYLELSNDTHEVQSGISSTMVTERVVPKGRGILSCALFG